MVVTVVGTGISLTQQPMNPSARNFLDWCWNLPFISGSNARRFSPSVFKDRDAGVNSVLLWNPPRLRTAIKIRPSSMFITGAMVLHNSICPHVVRTLQGTRHLLEDTGPSQTLRYVIT